MVPERVDSMCTARRGYRTAAQDASQLDNASLTSTEDTTLQPPVKLAATPRRRVTKSKPTGASPEVPTLSPPDNSLAANFTPPPTKKGAKRHLESPTSDSGVQQIATPSKVEGTRKTRRAGTQGTAVLAVTGPPSAAAPTVKPVVGGKVLPAVRAWTIESLEEAARHLAVKDASMTSYSKIGV
jgi:hypothetical protein